MLREKKIEILELELISATPERTGGIARSETGTVEQTERRTERPQI